MKLGVPWNPRERRPAGSALSQAADSASVHERIDDLTRQLDRLTRLSEGKHPGEGKRRPTERRPPTERPPEAPAREVHRYAGDRRLNPNPLRPSYSAPDLDQAVADITARQRALESRGPLSSPRRFESAPPPPPAPSPLRPAPAGQDLSVLEERLRTITNQIESLRPPSGLEEAVPALRQELSQISRTLSEAMPQRAIEAIEGEIRALSQRLDQTRHAGADGKALASIERGLGEVRDALHGLTPAESLVGFQSAIQSLARKVDAIAASQQDPAILQQLEGAVTGLRGIVSHVASDDTLAHLTEEVRGLAAKVERVAAQSASPAAISNLENRVGAIAEALDRRNARGQQVPEQVESAIKGLAEKVEKLQLSRGDTIAFGQLEERITKLVEKLDSSGSRLGHLEAIERGLADVMLHLDGQRGKATAQASPAAEPPEVDTLKRDLAAVNGTLNRVVERLATIETSIRSGGRPPAALPIATTPAVPAPTIQLQPHPAERVSSPPNPPPAAPAPAAAFAAPAQPMPAMPAAAGPAPAVPFKTTPKMQPSQRLAAVAPASHSRPPPRELAPIDPSLPPDHPLEPGAAPRTRVVLSPTDRIAASEAALGPARPPASEESGSKSNFITAARRAALAATRVTESFRPAAPANDVEKEPLHRRMGNRLRSLLVGASIVVLAIGGLRVVTDLLEPADAPVAQPIKPASPPSRPANPIKRGVPSRSGDETAPRLPTAAPGERSRGDSGDSLPPPRQSPGALPTAATAVRSTTPSAAPAHRLPQHTAGDVTGSIPAAPDRSDNTSLSPDRGEPQAPNQATHKPDALAAAAAAGDPAAAYELAVRYIEGRGAPQSYADAARWLEPAATHGLAPAQFRLATLYEKGHGVKKDLQAARRLYLAAAEKGNAKAMHNLAVLYAEGIKGKPDYTLAAEWFRKAADHGVVDSQYNLGVLYTRGFGVERNLAEAFKWFTLAAQQGDRESVRKRDEIAGRLDARTLAAAKLSAKAWSAKPQPEEAITVNPPPGGWDRQVIAPVVKHISRQGVKQRPQPSAPLKIGPG